MTEHVEQYCFTRLFLTCFYKQFGNDHQKIVLLYEPVLGQPFLQAICRRPTCMRSAKLNHGFQAKGMYIRFLKNNYLISRYLTEPCLTLSHGASSHFMSRYLTSRYFTLLNFTLAYPLHLYLCRLTLHHLTSPWLTSLTTSHLIWRLLAFLYKIEFLNFPTFSNFSNISCLWYRRDSRWNFLQHFLQKVLLTPCETTPLYAR